MGTRSAYVKLGWGASAVGAVMILLYIVLRIGEAQMGNLELLLGVGVVLVVGGILGGMTVSRTGPNR